MNDLSPDAMRTLASVLDTLIPPSEDARLPGAGEIGLADVVGRIPELRQVIEQGVRALDELAGQRGSAGFAALSAEARAEVLNEVTAREPAFVPGLVFQTYSNYYQSPRVLEALGMPGRPPHPLGYPLETGDLGLLDAVRGRTGMFRECD